MGKKSKPAKHGPIVAFALSTLEISQAELARRMVVDSALVSQWASGKRPIAPKHAARFEEVTNGRVTRIDLHPEIFS